MPQFWQTREPIRRVRMEEMVTRHLQAIGLITIATLFAAAAPCHAQDFGSAIADYFINWFPRVTQIQSEQPHWVTPLVTVTPRLEEELRYDQLWQANKLGVATDNFGGSKGLELIPIQNTEVILGIPPWIAHNGHIERGPDDASDGWGDETFLVKYRLLSANEDNGNYILTAFMGFLVPTGARGNSAGHAEFTPTIAGGKGFGDFDVQSTVGVTFPNGGEDRLGWPLAWNTAFQYHVLKYFWPEFETNYTWFAQGERTGQSQLFLTPGILFGRFPIHDRVGVTIGGGFQVAVTTHPAYNHAAILSARIPF
jgi:hypothetical protein